MWYVNLTMAFQGSPMGKARATWGLRICQRVLHHKNPAVPNGRTVTRGVRLERLSVRTGSAKILKKYYSLYIQIEQTHKMNALKCAYPAP
jgi:hypothetical protein